MRYLQTNRLTRKLKHLVGMVLSYAKSYIFFQGWRSYTWYENELKVEGGGGQRKLTLAAFSGPRRGHKQFCADPFLFRHNDKNYLFYETVDAKEKGFIGCLKEENGKWIDFGCVLKELWHLSYPQVIEEDGKIYMVPESCDFGKGGVYMYDAVDFPLKWKRVSTLIDRPFADSTLLKHEGHWYMACYTIPPHESAELWCAPSLFGPWERHPCWNKINQSRRLRRCGGRYITRGEKLYRVAQDCNGPLYGKRLFMVEVKKISPTEYEEGEATLLHDRNMPPYNYCHTYNEMLFNGQRLSVVDVHYNVLKWPHRIVYDVVRGLLSKIHR